MDETEPLLYLLNFNDLKYIQMNKVQTFTTTCKGGSTQSPYSANHLIKERYSHL